MGMSKMRFALAYFVFFLFLQDALLAPSDGGSDDDDADSDWDEGTDAESTADDDGRVYKNPRNSPSAQCPRDEDQATLLGQKCLRKCSSDEDCKSKKKKCLCDGACGMSCIKPDRECPELEQPEVGSVSVTGRLFGNMATYTCPHGTHVVGLQNRNCQADGQWAGQAPSCKQNIYCLSPPTIEHARHSALPEQATFDLDATVQYHCHTGYVTNGFPRAKCLAIDNQASWYGPDISCEPRSCGAPGEVPHGWVTADCHTFGCRALLQCGAGFELVGKAERFCQADGSWAPKELPTCVLVTAVQCASPEAPRHGKAVYTSCAYNSVVSYECKYGYRLVGDSTRRCGADKKWSGSQPSCKEINCGHPGRLWNGWLENIEAGTGLGASIIFRCHDGMKMEGNSSTVCLIDGTWRYQLPKCLAPCVVPHVTQGNVILVDNTIQAGGNETTGPPTTQVVGTSTMVQHGELLIVDCEKNYEFPSTGSSVTCNNGTWTHIPRCQPARCKKLPKPPKNGMVIAPKTEHGMRSKFRCKDGFELHGPYFVVCSFGNWTGEFPTCQEVYCPFPGYIENGKVLLVGNMGLYDYRPYVRKVVNNKQIMYDCDKGYVLSEGPPGATCIGGVWRPKELPRCTLGQHPRLRWSRRRRSIQPTLLRHRRVAAIRKYYHDLRKRSADIDAYIKSTTNPLRHSNSKLQERIEKRVDSDSNDSEYLKSIPRNVYTDSATFNSLKLDSIERERKSQLLLRIGRSFQNRLKATEFLEKYYTQKWKAKIAHRNKRSVMNFNIDDDNNTSKMPETMYQLRMKAKALFNNSSMANIIIDVKRLVEKEFTNVTFANETDTLATRKKRTSRKTDRLNQTTASVPKSGRDSKGTKNRESGQPAIPDGSAVPDEDDSKNGTDSVAEESKIGNRKVGRPKAPCDVLASEPYVNIEIVKHGRDPNITYSAGTVVRVACGKGYGLNVGNNSTAKCVRGRWKPAMPVCEILPCHIPVTEFGIYSVQSTDGEDGPNSISPLGNGYRELNVTDDVENGQVVHFSCDYGYNVQGPSNLRCWHGDWAVTSLPECIAAPCELPPLRNAGYESGYRAGLTIAHDSSVGFHCDTGYTPGGVFNCHLGRLQPSIMDYCSPIVGSNFTRSHVSEYTSGSDIVKGDVSDLEDAGFGNTDCPQPTRVQGTLIYKDSSVSNGTVQSDGDKYPHGTEVTFRCIASIVGEMNTWKIICENGNWVGRSSNCDEVYMPTSSPYGNISCTFLNEEPNVVSFYNDLEVKEQEVDFPPGAILVSRCVDIGKYAMTGSGNRQCINGVWDGTKPECFGLNQENDYAMEKPPTILFRHQLGPIAQSNDGKLIIYPGTILHMECLWMRRFGNPKWQVSHEYRKYPEGWSMDPGRDSQLEFRLSIFHATKDDSGVFTCETPARQSHQVEIIVEAVHCSALPLRRGLNASDLSTKMGSEIAFSCANGNSLIGAPTLLCQPSGNWSAPLPLCESVECGDLILPVGPNGARPRVAIVSRGVGGRAAFSCSPGWGLRGPTETVCLPSGKWGKPFPTCVEVTCPAPAAPLHGAAVGRAPFRAGDVVQFTCGPARAMEGRPIAACQDNARWSAPTPKCVQACPYPGTTISGRMSAVKFYYKIGETITFTCEPGLQLRGAPMLRCLRNGKWSNAIPLCLKSSALNHTTYLTDNEELAMLSDSSISAGLRNAAESRINRLRAVAFNLKREIARRSAGR